MKKFLIGLVIVIVIIGIWFLGSNFKLIKIDKSIACTEEAKICPDGSMVSRGGVNCEFAECPKQNSSVMTKDDWQAKLSEITNLLVANFSGEGVGKEGSRPISIAKEFNTKEINGAIISLGVGGAYMDEMAVVVLVDGQFKIADVVNGTEKQRTFLSGASAARGSTIDFSSDKSVLYIANQENGVDYRPTCDLKAYTWDSQSKLFVTDLKNTPILKAEYCKDNLLPRDI